MAAMEGSSDGSSYDVIVVGAGPVGLLTGLRVAQAGIRVTVLEALPKIEDSPRAMAYQPVAVKELDRAGILDDVRKIGGRSQKVCWRRTSDGKVIADIERTPTPDHPYENLIIGQHELAAVILEHLQRFEKSEILFEHRVVAIEQQADKVSVTTEDPHGQKKTFQASYLIGADGGKSSIRRLCNISFDGFTWPQQLVSTNVYYPFGEHGWEDGNFMIDPVHWALIAKINNKNLWRVSYGELDGLNHEQLRERLPMKFDHLLPGSKPLDYKVDQFSPYRIHQRCASTFRQGRVLLAGDAAHLCNPFGGLGLTGGLLDAAALADALIAVCTGQAPDSLLDKYAELRRNIFLDIVNPTSQANKRRLHECDPNTVGETDPFLKMLRDADTESKQKIRGHSGLAVDMSQFLPKNMGSTALA